MTNTNELTFNTRRLYTKHGQRIGAVVIDMQDCDGFNLYTVAFADIDRGIDGIMQVTRFNADAIMHQYDYNRYKYAQHGAPRDGVDRAAELARTAPSI
jgi:hypothetical protein